MQFFPANAFDKLGFHPIVEKLISYTRTLYGVEDVQHLKPSSDVLQIESSQQITREWMNLLQTEDALPLETLHDIRPSLQRAAIENAFISARELLYLGQTLSTFRKIRLFLEKRQELCPVSFSIQQHLILLKESEERISKTVDEQGEVKDSASPELRKIRINLQSKRAQVRTSLQRFIKMSQKSGAATDEATTIRNGRMVIPLKAEFKREYAGFIHDVSSTGQTVYFEPAETLHLNNDIRRLEAEEAHEIERILKEITAHIRPFVPDISNNLLLLGQLDSWQAKARLSVFLHGSLASLSKKNRIGLLKARNPNLLLKFNGKQKEVVPLDLELNAEELLLMITGPNAGGKSVAMKTIGLCVLLNQVGLAIPALEPAELPVFDGLFVDLGDDQSLENDLSTFSSRLVWMRETEKRISPNSLVLVDEAGAGTDPDEGSSLFQAFFERLIQRNARIIVTTHHGRLKVFAHEHPHAVNGSMIFNQNALQPTYQFQKGVPGSSYAFEISGRLDIEPGLIARARELLGNKTDAMELLINDLEKEQHQVRELKNRLTTELFQAEELKKEYEEKSRTIRHQKEKIKNEAVSEAKLIVQNANREVERLVEEIRKNQAEKETIKQVRSSLEKLKKEVSKKHQTELPHDTVLLKEKPELNDWVLLVNSGNTGQLIELQGKRAVVSVNGMRVVSKYSELRKTNPPKETKPKKKVIEFTVEDRHLPDLRAPGFRLDLRGKRVEEVDMELIPFIDKTFISGLSEVEIIHGKGTGALRHYIRDRLKVDNRIAKVEDASWENGGPGCSIVFFKKEVR